MKAVRDDDSTEARHKNLVKFDEMSPEQHRELSRRGGLASAESRRKSKERSDAIGEMCDHYLQRFFALDELRDEVEYFFKEEPKLRKALAKAQIRITELESENATLKRNLKRRKTLNFSELDFSKINFS